MMSLREWWRNRSGRAKAVTVLATILILQIGLCFGTPSIVNSFQAIFHLKPSDDEFGDGLGYMMLEALLCIVTLLALIVVPLFFRSRSTPQRLFDDEYQRNKQDHD
jgi:hypothetical protein